MSETWSGGASGPQIMVLVSSMQGGGAERVASLLCNRWAAEGNRVTLMPTYSEGGRCVYRLDDRVTLDFLANHSSTRSGSLWGKVSRFMSFREVIRTRRPDVIVSFLARVNVAAILAAKGSGIHIVVAERNNPDQEQLGSAVKILRRLLYRYADVVVVQTRHAGEWIEKYCGPANVAVIPNPVIMPLPVVPPVIEPDSRLAPDRRVVLGIGRLVAQKNFSCLIKAFAMVCEDFPDWDLVIIGEGPLRDELERVADESGLASRITLAGWVGNVGNWYERADIYVMSSVYEGFPNTLLEALAYGVPSISFDCESGPRDLIRDKENGLLVPPERGHRGIGDALRTLMCDEVGRGKIASAALEVRERFSMDVIDRRWAQVLGMVRESRRAAGSDTDTCGQR